MSDVFTKLYGDRLINSSLWLESMEVRCLWFYMLAKADWNGLVNTPSVRVLAHAANMPLDAVERALEVLESPDPESRTPDNEGRRVARVDGGWRILNHQLYRDMRTKKQVEDAERSRAKYQKSKAENKRVSKRRRRSPRSPGDLAQIQIQNAQNGTVEYEPAPVGLRADPDNSNVEGGGAESASGHEVDAALGIRSWDSPNHHVPDREAEQREIRMYDYVTGKREGF